MYWNGICCYAPNQTDEKANACNGKEQYKETNHTNLVYLHHNKFYTLVQFFVFTIKPKRFGNRISHHNKGFISTFSIERKQNGIHSKKQRENH